MANDQMPEEDNQEWGPMVVLRKYLMEQGSPIAHDVNENDIAKNVDTSSSTAHNYADGGIVGDSKNEYDPMDGTLTPYMAGGGILPDKDQLNGNPTFQPEVEPAPSTPTTPLPGMGPEVTPQSLESIMGRTEQPKQPGIDISPEGALNFDRSLIKGQTGIRQNLANAGAGFADALMQGVARAGPSNFQQSLQNRNDKFAAEEGAAMDKYRAGKGSERKQALELANGDPSSPISKMAQKTERPTLLKLGYTDAEINQMPASLIPGAVTRSISQEDVRNKLVEAEARIAETGTNARLMAGARGKELENTKAEQTRRAAEAAAERELKSRKDAVDVQQGAARALEPVGAVRKMTAGLPIIGDPAVALLKKQAAGQTAQPQGPIPVNSQEEYDALPSGSPYVDSHGTQGVKR